MWTTALQTHECCAWCRRPVSKCTAPACESIPTYSGILVRGQWIEVAASPGAACEARNWPTRVATRLEPRARGAAGAEISALP